MQMKQSLQNQISLSYAQNTSIIERSLKGEHRTEVTAKSLRQCLEALCVRWCHHGRVNAKTEGDDAEWEDETKKRDGSAKAARFAGMRPGLRIDELTKEDVMGLHFGSEKEAGDFYETYSKSYGFAVRKDDVKKDARGQAMFYKHPKSVVTDGDGAMREVIKQVFPNASHRLCAWHLQKNACENVKSASFLQDFQTAVYSNFTPEKFEDYWEKMVLKHGLVGNNWVTKTYENKSLWATAYFRDKFFGRIRTTSQCEAINSFIKAYVRKRSSFVELMHNIDQTLREYRNNELMADYKTLFTEPVLTTSLSKIEKDAAKTYTQEIFKEVKREIEKAGALIVIERRVSGDKLLFKLSEYCNRSKERIVDYDSPRSIFCCQCRLFESRGIPCSHIICVMKNEHVDHIPRSLVLARWRKSAKRNFMSGVEVQEVSSDVNNSSQIAALSAAFRRLCNVTEKNRTIFNDLMDGVFNVVEKYEKRVGQESSERSSIKEVRDPTSVKTKGAPKKKKFCTRRKKHCSNCSSTGHTIRRCPLRNGTNGISKEDVDKLSSDSSDTCKDHDSDEDETLNERAQDGDNVQPRVIISQNKGKDKIEDYSKRKKTKVKAATQESETDNEDTFDGGFPDGENFHPQDIGSQNVKVKVRRL
ncbi:Zinc finger, CCHC-type [Sesbania bispinosa]|nr:Zinc finger, CCHC-type [Sesbania bispinosa]